MKLNIDKYLTEGNGGFLDKNNYWYEHKEDYINNIFDICGCSENTWMQVVIDILDYINQEDTMARETIDTIFYGNSGLFYLVMNQLDNIGLIEHGIAIRGAWITDYGKEILEDLKIILADEINN